MKKIDWDTYYLAQCYLVAQRSIDQSTKCGAIIVSKDGRVLSQGYNGPIRNSDDLNFPIERPKKYYMTLHAEENALLAYNGSYQDIQGATIYVTGRPCNTCLRMIIQKGISKVVHLKVPLTQLQKNDEILRDTSEEMIRRYAGDFEIVELDVMNDIFTCYDKCKLDIINRMER